METETSFTVKHEEFEGPIEVLLDLIERRKLFVNDVSLASVTDEFLSHIQMKGMVAEQVANFLAVAATLILIKARSLLPNLELTPEENESITDLERRVALYQIISQVSTELIKAYGKQVSFGGRRPPSAPVFAPDATLSVAMLPELVAGIVVRTPAPTPKKPEARVRLTISMGEVIERLAERIERAMESLTFDDIRVHAPDADAASVKVYTIVSFLGMLELVRRGLIAVEQDAAFERITLEKSSAHTKLSAI